MNANTNNFLSIIEGYILDNADDIGQQIADNFRSRRIEKNITRQRIADMSGVPISNITRFEKKGLISLKSLIKLAMALGYTSEIKNLFSEAKFDTMEELEIIRRKQGKKRAYVRNKSAKKLQNEKD